MASLPLAVIPPHVLALADYEALAREHLDPAIWAWLSGGSADELTLRDNAEAFQRIRLQHRVLKPMQGANTTLTLFDRDFPYPIFLAPVAYHRLLHKDGELATAIGASAMKAGMVVSTQASTRLEDIAAASTSPLWFQLYCQASREHTLALVKSAEAAGYQALVLTVDAPVNGIRNREQRAGFRLPPDITAVNLASFPVQANHVAKPGESPVFGSYLLENAPDWDDIAWLCRQTRLPVLLKGILSPQDARLAIEQGVSGIVVSNHGGRTLDGLPATIDALPAVVAAVHGRIPVLLDGGIRRGTDVLKALALGATAVMVGRPCLYGLAVAGAAGVAHSLHILRTELEVAMALAGCASLKEIDSSCLFTHG